MGRKTDEAVDGFRVDFEPVGPLQIPMPVVKEPGGRGVQERGEPQAPNPDEEIDDTISYLESAVASGEEFSEYLDRAIEVEECSFCAKVMRDLKGRPVGEQVQGIRELSRLKDAMTQDEMPGQEELAELVEDFEVVDLGAQL